MRTRVYSPRLIRLLWRHTALQGAGSRDLRASAYRALCSLLEPDEDVLAYADRLRKGESGALEVLMLTANRFIRAVVLLPEPASKGHRQGEPEVRRVQARREYLPALRVDVFLPPEVVLRTAQPDCQHAEVSVWLPPALRRFESEEWWLWDSPVDCDEPLEALRRPGEGRAELWKRGLADFNSGVMSPTGG